MGGNIPGGNFPGGIHQGGVWLVDIFQVIVFLILKKICAMNSQVYMHWHWSSSEKSSFSKPIASVFSPPPIIIFSYGVNIFPHMEMKISNHIWVFLESTWKTKARVPEYVCNALY